MNIDDAKLILQEFTEYLKKCSVWQWESIKSTPLERVYNDKWYAEVTDERLCNVWDVTRCFSPTGRFGIDHAMIYLSTSLVNLQLEMREKYRKNPELYDMDEPWNDMMKSSLPIVQVEMENNGPLFDIRSPGDGRWLARALRSSGYKCDVQKLIWAIHYMGESIYSETQKLAQLIYENGFDGILFRPVRQPEKPPAMNTDGQCSQGGAWVATNLALFKCPVRWALLTNPDVVKVNRVNIDKRLAVYNPQEAPVF